MLDTMLSASTLLLHDTELGQLCTEGLLRPAQTMRHTAKVSKSLLCAVLEDLPRLWSRPAQQWGTHVTLKPPPGVRSLNVTSRLSANWASLCLPPRPII